MYILHYLGRGPASQASVTYNAVVPVVCLVCVLLNIQVPKEFIWGFIGKRCYGCYDVTVFIIMWPTTGIARK